ncbi:MAG: hypothetical protein ABFC71_08690 [Methanoregula sp.]|jgi:hypothetical protein
MTEKTKTGAGESGEVTIKGIDSGLIPNSNDSDEIKKIKLKLDGDIYKWVILFLGFSILLVIIAVSVLVGLGKTIPDGIIAIGSAAVGAMAGILAPSPTTNK